MDMKIKEKFEPLWKKYFNDAELPISFYYTDEEGHAELVKPTSAHRCVIRDLAKVRKGNFLLLQRRFNRLLWREEISWIC